MDAPTNRPAATKRTYARLSHSPERSGSENSPLPLDPSYEPTLEPRDPAHEATFAVLQRCRAAKLVEPVGAVHMYDAAAQSKACRLTPLGRRVLRVDADPFWRLAEAGLL